MTFLVYHTRVGDAGRVRTVEVDAVQADSQSEACERITTRYGEGAINIVKVERA